MSDLPEIRNGHRREEISYGTDPESHFQRLVRFLFCYKVDLVEEKLKNKIMLDFLFIFL